MQTVNVNDEPIRVFRYSYWVLDITVPLIDDASGEFEAVFRELR